MYSHKYQDLEVRSYGRLVAMYSKYFEVYLNKIHGSLSQYCCVFFCLICESLLDHLMIDLWYRC